MVEQIVVNLASNALRAIEGEGSVTVRTALIDADDPHLERHPDVAKRPYVLVEVSDTGTGLSADQLGTIFLPFATSHADSGGTGMGLAIVRDLVAGAGGHITVENSESGGAAFRVYLRAVDLSA